MTVTCINPIYITTRKSLEHQRSNAGTRRSHPVTLVLDLDETLVHCSIEPIEDADLQFEVNFGGLMYHVYVRKRPHLEKFLEVVSKQFEVLVFTASQQVYAEKLLNLIDPTRKLIKHRLYRDSCLDVCDNFLKDLNVRSSSVEFENIFL